MSPTTGEYDTEVCLPVRVEYTRDAQEEWHATRLTLLVPGLETVEIPFAALPATEQRSLRQALAEAAALHVSEVELEQQLAAWASREWLREQQGW